MSVGAEGAGAAELVKLRQFSQILKAGILKKIGDNTKAIDTLTSLISAHPN